jgi:transcriptional regulator
MMGSVYVPGHFQATDEEIRAALRSSQAVDLVTATEAGLAVTLLPMLWDEREARPGLGTWGALVGHVARANPQWKNAPIGAAMVIVRGPDAYISPRWYATKREHGRVVPTWNYLRVLAYGQLIVHDDVRWLDGIVRRLTDRYEASAMEPWSVDDAPSQYVEGQLRAIVGVEVVIDRVVGKWKLSQNRSTEDIAGVVVGLEGVGEQHVSAAMRALPPKPDKAP